MSDSPLAPHLASPAELKERLKTERAGKPFLVYRDDAAAQRLLVLGQEPAELTIGSAAEADVALPWDDRVSALHAELRRVAGEWLVVDDGLSRNGTHLNGERVVGRRRLRDGDELRIGRTVLAFRQPEEAQRKVTVVAEAEEWTVELSPAQQRVLLALSRPFSEGGDAFARPPTNQEIAEHLCLSVAAVKTHLRALFSRFGIEGLPQNEKRVELARRALASGAVTMAELKRGD